MSSIMKSKSIVAVMLVATTMLSAQTITTDKPSYEVGEQVVIDFKQVPIGSNLYLYQNYSLVPNVVCKENITQTDDKLVSSVLESGIYEAVSEFNSEKANSAQFVVKQPNQTSNDALKIFLATDIHVMAKSLVINQGSAYNNAMASNRKLLGQSEDVFFQIIDTILSQKPDIVLLPGDLTKDGEKISHEVVVKGLNMLKQNGITVLVIPGNHDYRSTSSVAYDGEQTVVTPTITESEFKEIYKDFGYDDSFAVQDTSSLSYYCDAFPSLRIIGIDATRNRENQVKQLGDASNKTYSDGLMRPNTLQFVLDAADQAADSGRNCIVMMHHQMLQHFTNQEKIFSSATIQKGDSIARLFAKHNIHIVFTGHMHINNISKIYNREQGLDSLVEISTGSTIEYPGCFRTITINPQRNLINISTQLIKNTALNENYIKYAQDELASHTEVLWGPMSNMIWANLRNLRNNNSLGAVPPFSTFFDLLINNQSTYSPMAYEYLKEPVKLTMLTASEANENYKKTEIITNMLSEQTLAFCKDVMTSNGFPAPQIQVVQNLLKSTTNKMYEDYLKSLLKDCTYCKTEDENTTNDLFVELHIKTPSITSNNVVEFKIENDNNYYDILGRKYTSRPTKQGIYLHNGEKIYIK